MSAEATGWVWRYSPFPAGAALLVHLAVADVVNDQHDNEFWMTTTNLAEKARCGRSSTVAALKTMCDLGLLEVIEVGGGRGKPTRYRFLMPEETARYDAAKPRDLSVETARSDGRNKEPKRTQEQKGETARSVDGFREPDLTCISCRGAGIIYSATAGADTACVCTWDPDYEPRPAVASKPPPDFGMPANRGGRDD